MNMRGRPRLNLRAFQDIRLYFVLGYDHVHHDFLLIPVSDGRCRRTWKVRPSTWTVQVSAWSSPVRLWLVVSFHHGLDRPIQLSHFSDSLAAISGFPVTFGATVGPVTGGSRESLHVGYIEGCAVHRLMSVSAAHLRCAVFSSCFHLI